MKILVLNCGSSSVKYQFIEMTGERVLAQGLLDKIGLGSSTLVHRPAGRDKVVLTADIYDHAAAIEMVVAALTSSEHGVVGSAAEIAAVGHRVVHGGEKFSASAVIDEPFLQQLRDCIELAPLHNPPNLKGIEACTQLMPQTPQVGVFDTAFHQSMPAHAYMYALPYVLYQRYGIRRYGFHGTSHFYVAHEAARLLGKPMAQVKVVTCHLGNGASVTAVANGKSLDTSMGFTPLEGLVMGTRCGDMDPAIILYLMAKEELTQGEANTLMNKHSGLQGLSGVSSDMRGIIGEMDLGNPRAQLAFQVYCYRVRKYIGSYTAAMGGLDAVVFTAGVGENSWRVREACCAGLECLGLTLDAEKNRAAKPGTPADVATADSRARLLVIPTNEELVIARDTRDIVFGKEQA